MFNVVTQIFDQNTQAKPSLDKFNRHRIMVLITRPIYQSMRPQLNMYHFVELLLVTM